MFIDRLIRKYGKNEPIFTREIVDEFNEYSRAYVFRLIDRSEKNGEIVSFDKGIYYLPTRTIVGMSTITAEDVVKKKYLSYKDNVYGIYGGLALMNSFYLTTQVPNTLEIITNRESMRKRRVEIDGRAIVLKKSRTPITKGNVFAYTVLELFSEIKSSESLDSVAMKSIIAYIKKNKIDVKDLISLAQFFPARTLKNLILSGVLNAFTRG